MSQDPWESYRQAGLFIMAQQLYPTWFERLLKEDPFKTLRDVDVTLMNADQLVRLVEDQSRLRTTR